MPLSLGSEDPRPRLSPRRPFQGLRVGRREAEEQAQLWRLRGWACAGTGAAPRKGRQTSRGCECAGRPSARPPDLLSGTSSRPGRTPHGPRPSLHRHFRFRRGPEVGGRRRLRAEEVEEVEEVPAAASRPRAGAGAERS